MESDAQNAARPGSTTSPATEGPTELNEDQPAPKEMPTVAPRVLKNRFELLGTLGEGGMGVVYKALDYQRRKSRDPVVHVALKVISEAIQQHTDAVLALQREFSRTLQLTHPNIVRTYDFDTDEVQNISFLTMELLEGESLDVVIKRYPEGVPPAEYLPLLKQLLDGLECAHRHGIVHSDLKPSNIFVTLKKQLKIMDFGIAAPLRQIGDPRPGTLFDPRKLGALSPSHACLEMFAGMTADPRDDLYSMGCLVYQLVSGKHPFRGARAPLALEEKLQVHPVATLSESANKALRGALQFHRADRIASVEEFRRTFFESDPVQVPRKNLRSTRRWAIPVAAGALLAGTLGVVAWQFYRSASESPVAEPPIANQPVEQESSAEQPPSGAPASSTEPSPSGTAASSAEQLPSETPAQSPPPASGSVTAAASGAPQALNADDAVFEQYCGEKPSRALLEGLLTRGLVAQFSLSSASTDAMRIEANDQLAKTAECIRALGARQISSVETRSWLADVDPLLKNAGKK